MLKNIVVKKDFMIRESIDKKTVELYKENLAAIVDSSPIVVFDTPMGLLLVDGFHRVFAARQLNWDAIKAEKHQGSVQDAFAYACLANLMHGKPLEAKERKKAICEFIKLNVQLSNVRIAQLTHNAVSDDTVRRWRAELEANGEIKPQDIRIDTQGKEHTVPISANAEIEVDPFEEWFKSHVVEGDIFEALVNDPLKYDLIIADPPYGILNNAWDKQTKYDLLNFTRRWFNLVLQHLKPTGRLFVFWSRKYVLELKPLFDEIQNEYPLNFGGIIVWNFRNSLTIPNNRKEFKITWEPIFYFYGLDASDLNRPDSELTGEKWDGIDSDVWTFAIPQSNYEDKKIHPAQKPKELYKHIIELATKPNDSVLDPFAGSGTTGHAAYELGREFKLIEKNLDYVEGIRNRLKGIYHNGGST